MLQLLEGRHEEAYLQFEEGVYLAKKLNLEYMKIRFLYALGLFEIATIPDGTLSKAESRLLSAERLASKVPFNEILWQIQSQIGRVCELTGRPEAAAEYKEKARVSHDATLESIPSTHSNAYSKVSVDADLDRLLEDKCALLMESQQVQV